MTTKQEREDRIRLIVAGLRELCSRHDLVPIPSEVVLALIDAYEASEVALAAYRLQYEPDVGT